MTNQIPTLFIGVGGIGCRIAAAFSDKLSDEDRKYVGVIGIDTDINDMINLHRENHKMTLIQISEDWSIDEYLEKHPKHEDWFPDYKYIRRFRCMRGCGQTRAISRLCYIAAEETEKLEVINEEVIRLLNAATGAIALRPIKIIIVGTNTGATGSDLLVQLPFYIRKNVITRWGIKKSLVVGIVIGSDVTSRLQPDKYMQENVSANDYASIKELNSFYWRQFEDKKTSVYETGQLELEDYDPNDNSPCNIPYDYIYKFEGSSLSWTVGRIDELMAGVAHFAFASLLAPVVFACNTVLDEYIEQSIRLNPFNRYVGAGLCRMIYPKERAQMYVALSIVNDLINDEWLLIDNRYRSYCARAIEAREQDPTASLPDFTEVYLDEFEKESINNTSSLVFEKYADEAFDKVDNQWVSRAAKYIQLIRDKIYDYLNKSEIARYKDACNFDISKMKDFDSAYEEITRSWKAISDYHNASERMIYEAPFSIVEDMIPASIEALKIQIQSPESIFSCIGNVHPIVARYLICSMIKILTAQTSEYKKELNIDLNAYLTDDYYTDDKKDTEIQDPIEALFIIKMKHDGFWGALGPLSEVFKSEEKALNSLSYKLADTVARQERIISKFLKVSLLHSVSTSLLERLKMLEYQYNKLFNVIERSVVKNKEILNELSNNTLTYGVEEVYSSLEAFERIKDEFKRQNSNKIRLSSDSAKVLFEGLFAGYVHDHQRGRFDVMESAEEKSYHCKRSDENLQELFSRTVVDDVQQYVIDNGRGIIDITFREALAREYELDKTNNQSLEEYITNRMNTGLRFAAPLINVQAAVDNDDMLIVMMSDKNSVLSDAQSTMDYYFGSDYPNRLVNVCFHPELKDDELTIIRVTKGYSVEDLRLYSFGSPNETAYNQCVYHAYEKNANSIVFLPHINKYWHEVGNIPSLLSEQRKRDMDDVARVFILGLGCSYFRPIEEHGHHWAFIGADDNKTNVLLRNGKTFGDSYLDLYLSLFFNGSIVRNILQAVSDPKVSLEISNKLSEGLIRVQNNGNDDCFSIYDVFVTMYPEMKDFEWNNLFDVLREIIYVMFVDLPDKDNKVKDLLNEIYDNSLYRDVAFGDLSKGQSEMKLNHQRISQ